MAVARQVSAQLRAALAAPDAGRRYTGTVLAVVALTGAMLLVRDQLGVPTVLLLFLLLSFVVALVAGSGPAAVAAFLSFVAFNFFFIPPFHTLTVDRAEHILALFVYLTIAIVTGQLVARVRERTDEAVREQRRTALLYELNAALIGDVTLDAILARIAERVVHVYGAKGCRVLLPDGDGQLAVRASYPAAIDRAPDRSGLAIAAYAMEQRTPAGRRTAGRRLIEPARPGGVGGRSPVGRAGPDVLYLPIQTAERVIGVLEVIGRPGGGRFRPEDEQLLTSFANQAALALERARLTEEASRAAVLAQSDELKSALLAAVSHDLRTPLASIKAAATSLLDRSVAWDEAARRDFLEAIDEETDRLTLMVGNLLDLSRIEGGALRPDKEWYDVAELVADVVGRVAGRAGDRPLTTEVAPGLPLVYFDYVEIAQVLLNLVENALKYTPAGTPITITARPVAGAVEVAVRDRGPGIPPTKLPHLFEKFYRADATGRVPGSGIGLTIAKGLVEAHGGRIWAESRPGAGTAFHFTLPVEDESGSRGVEESSRRTELLLDSPTPRLLDSPSLEPVR